MSVVDCIEGYTGVEFSGDDSAYRMTRAFTVLTDDPADGLLVVKTALPAAGEAHPENAWYTAGVPKITKRGPTLFAVKVVYSTSAWPTFPQVQDPLSEPADISWEDADNNLPYDRDMDDEPVVNVLGEPFDPPLRRNVSDPVLIIERNQAAFTPTTKLTYQDTICTEVFYGAGIGKARMGRIRARLVNAAPTPYWRTRYEIIFRMITPPGTPEGKEWWRCILNQGVKYLLAPDGMVQLTGNGEVVSLNEDGTQVPLGGDPYWLYFREFPDQSWAALGLEP